MLDNVAVENLPIYLRHVTQLLRVSGGNDLGLPNWESETTYDEARLHRGDEDTKPGSEKIWEPRRHYGIFTCRHKLLEALSGYFFLILNICKWMAIGIYLDQREPTLASTMHGNW